jgi:hypothetical protein
MLFRFVKTQHLAAAKLFSLGFSSGEIFYGFCVADTGKQSVGRFGPATSPNNSLTANSKGA